MSAISFILIQARVIRQEPVAGLIRSSDTGLFLKHRVRLDIRKFQQWQPHLIKNLPNGGHAGGYLACLNPREGSLLDANSLCHTGLGYPLSPPRR